MTRNEEIKEIVSTLHQGMKPLQETYDTTTLATILYDAGWHRLLKAEWIPCGQYSEKWGVETINYYTCSNCQRFEYTNDKHYCATCGAHMRGDDQ